MITAADVCLLVREQEEYGEMTQAQLLPLCQMALDYVKRRLRKGIEQTNPMIAQLAAAQARFLIFNQGLGGSDRFKSYKVGDMTIHRDFEKEYEIEKHIRDEAFICAASILKDGGFFFAEV